MNGKMIMDYSILELIGGIVAVVFLLAVIFTQNDKKTLATFGIAWVFALGAAWLAEKLGWYIEFTENLNVNVVSAFVLPPLAIVSWVWLFLRHTLKFHLILAGLLIAIFSLSPEPIYRHRSKGIEW